MDMSEGLVVLNDLCKNNDWFYDLALDRDKFIVYTRWINKEVLEEIPDMVANKQVLVHFANYKTANKEVFTNSLVPANNDVNLRDLIDELDTLESVCGPNILNDIFYEVHDGKNAVTNLSMKYPEVRSRMEKLYSEYGFDVVYEELDG